ncbi:hypothetical protein BCR42DRAFT_418444 [Absidia repens]|uniref:Uncharacterized protein n=1 Tax=Absidia repens TaxID=90262 RepID=A0A1X2IBR7_9FUNG|nr:hypothetical protein BCR42DRAFT_418444 [Absidia repens]
MGDSTSTKARPFVAPLVGHHHLSSGSEEDGNSVGYYSPSQRPPQQQPQQPQDYYQDHDFYAAPYQYMANHPMQYPQQNQSGSTQPSSSAERHIPHLVQEHDNDIAASPLPSHSIDVPHSKDE